MDLKLDLNKSLYLFELDDVMFPRKDYILQVYYLFASFYEFSEGGTVKAQDMVEFMKKIHIHHGEETVFSSTQLMYNMDEKYKENFERLKANAQLPLKLELFPEISKSLQMLEVQQKQMAILTKGNPVEQLNKLKFIDWSGLENCKDKLKVFFFDELSFQDIDPLDYIAKAYALDKESVAYIQQI